MTLSAIRDALTRVPEAEHRRAVALVLEAKRKNRRLFFIGNGGSAAIASHMAADFAKAGEMRALCFNDAALMSALANDEGYQSVFEWPMSLHSEPEDVLFAISSSGKSESITRPARVAKSIGVHVITLSGFSETNPLRKVGNVNFYVASNKYGVVEVAHHAICHSILDAVIA